MQCKRQKEYTISNINDVNVNVKAVIVTVIVNLNSTGSLATCERAASLASSTWSPSAANSRCSSARCRSACRHTWSLIRVRPSVRPSLTRNQLLLRRRGVDWRPTTQGRLYLDWTRTVKQHNRRLLKEFFYLRQVRWEKFAPFSIIISVMSNVIHDCAQLLLSGVLDVVVVRDLQNDDIVNELGWPLTDRELISQVRKWQVTSICSIEIEETFCRQLLSANFKVT